MKKLISIASMIFAFVVLWQGCTKPEETGIVYGTVTDFATGEPMKDVAVKLMPVGETTLTGSDGTYSFQRLKKGQYTLALSKAGYEALDVSVVVDPAMGMNVCRDIQMKQEVALQVEPDHLDFGAEADDVSRLFNIVNNSGSVLSWQITKSANWIQSVSETSGTLSPGSHIGVVVVIDRNKLQQGENTTILHVTSNNGNQQLTIKATRTDVSTLEATSVTGNSAVLNGKINTNKPYSEKGFYYGTNHNLNTKVVVNGNGTGIYSKSITGLSATQTYYFKAYCVIDGEYLYGEEKSFGPVVTSVFEFNGHTYMVAPDPHTSSNQYITWSAANSYCENLTCWGYSDWRLPTIEELETMYQLRETIGGFICENNPLYHSSTEAWNGYHYYVDFISGETSASFDIEYFGHTDFNTIYRAHVRPVRIDNK